MLIRKNLLQFILILHKHYLTELFVRIHNVRLDFEFID